MARAQLGAPAAVGALAFIGTLVGAALLFQLLDQAWDPMMDVAANSTNTTQANASVTRFEDAWNNWVYWVLPLAAVLGLAAAAAAGRVR